MQDVRAIAAKNLSRVISNGASFTGNEATLINPDSSPEENAEKTAALHVEKRDIAFYRELCFGTLRHFFLLDAIAKSLLKKPLHKKDTDIHALLLIGLYQIIYLRTPNHAALSATVNASKALKKVWAKGLLNAVMRNFLRAGDNWEDALLNKQSEAIKASHPHWLYQKIIQQWPEQQRTILDYNNSTPPMALRINPAKISRADYIGLLAKEDIVATTSRRVESGILLTKPVDVARLPSFEKGWASVQDIGAQLAAACLDVKPGQHVLDACAAPGGKTCHLLESVPDITLTAVDSNSTRLLQVEQNIERCGLNARLIHANAVDLDNWWDSQCFDRILLDAPCSGTGIISHHPDIKLLRRSEDIDSFAQQQLLLLLKLWRTLKEGGELLYCTCSIMSEENQNLIQTFLEKTASACLAPLNIPDCINTGTGYQLLPNPGKNGGFFYAKLSKQASV